MELLIKKKCVTLKCRRGDLRNMPITFFVHILSTFYHFQDKNIRLQPHVRTWSIITNWPDQITTPSCGLFSHDYNCSHYNCKHMDESPQLIWSGPFVNDSSSPQHITFHRVRMNTSHPIHGSYHHACSGYQSCTLISSDMYYHNIRHIVVYHRVCYVYHGTCNGYHHCLCVHVMAYHHMISHHIYTMTMKITVTCNGYHHSLTMMITVTCTMITVTYTMIYHYMPDDMTVHVWWWQYVTDIHYMTDDSFHGVLALAFHTGVKCSSWAPDLLWIVT